MRRYFYNISLAVALASLAIATVSCVKTSTETPPCKGCEIAFYATTEQSLEAVPRGVLVDNTLAYDLGVYAREDGGAVLIDNCKAVPTAGAIWETTTDYYWPGDDADYTLHFQLYSPYIGSSSASGLSLQSSTAEKLEIAYTAPTQTSLQPDLMVSEFVSSKRCSAVDVELCHALSSIAFSVKGDATTTISSIRLLGVVGSTLVAVDSKGLTITPDESSSAGTAFVAGLVESAGANADQSLRLITAADGYLIMSPQVIPTDAILELTTIDAAGITETTSYNLSKSRSEWVSGMTYNYTITIANKEIVIEDVVVEPWQVSTVDVEVQP